MEITGLHYETQEPIRVAISDGMITAVDPVQMPRQDAMHLPTVAPGLLDIQVNGFGGRWFSSEHLTCDDVQSIVMALLERGVARCLPTLITNSAAALRHGMLTIADTCRRDPLVANVIRGIHLEGPWISPEDGPRGAHPIEHVRAVDLDELERLSEASGGLLKILTVAPEIAGSSALIQAAVQRGIVISIGHTAATANDIRAAVAAGASMSTHLGNGCGGTLDRHINPLWPQLADDRLIAGVISDGCHLPDDVLTCLVRCKGLQRVIVTCDVSGFAGCPVGRHTHGGLAVEVLSDGRIVVADQRQYLAGSGATTLECLPQAMRALGLSVADVWPLVSHNPETALQQQHVRLSVGSEATLNVWQAEPQVTGGNLPEFSSGANAFRPVETIIRGISVGAAV